MADKRIVKHDIGPREKAFGLASEEIGVEAPEPVTGKAEKQMDLLGGAQ